MYGLKFCNRSLASLVSDMGNLCSLETAVSASASSGILTWSLRVRLEFEAREASMFRNGSRLCFVVVWYFDLES